MKRDTLEQLLDWCIERQVSLALEGEQLKVYGQPGAMTPELVDAIRARKPELLDWLRQQQRGSTGQAAAAALQPVPRDGARYPLSYAQQRVWFIDRFEGSVHYNMAGAFRLSGSFDTALANEALRTVVARHEVLRTTFHEGEEGPWQLVGNGDDFVLAVSDLSGMEADAQEQAVQAALAADAAKPFDLAHDLMLRAAYLRCGQGEGVLLLNLHHIACDGWSLDVLVKEFAAAYQALQTGQEPALAALPLQYIDYAVWQRGAANAAHMAQQISHWREALADCPPIHSLPLDFARPAQQTFRARSHAARLDKEAAAALAQLAKQHDATLFMLLQSAFALLLARWSGEQDVMMAVPVAGRSHPRLEPLIGFFVNTLPFRTRIDRAAGFAELLAQGREFALQAYANQDVPFELLVDQLRPERDLAFNPLCQVKFLLQNKLPEELSLPGLALSPLIAEEQQIRFDLDLTVTETPNGLFLNWTYKEDLFKPGTIARMAETFACLLRAIVADPHARLEELPLLDSAAHAAWLAESCGADATDGRELSVVQAFEQQAARTPHAIAVRHAGVALDYATLERRANRLAHFLAEQGVEAGQRVGIYVERSAQLLVAMLGILKAGAAYVPFEPKNTRERIGHIIADAGIEWVLVQPGMMDRVPVAGIDVLALDDSDGWLAEYPSDAPAALAGPGDVAYVIYTSGSTGTPKGVEIFHSGLADYLAFAGDAYYDPALQGSLVVTSHGFDITVPALWLPLLRGDCVNLLEAGEELPDLAARLAAPDAAGQLLRMTPMHVRGLLDLLPQQPLAGRHTFVVGGEAFTVALARELQQRFPHSQLFNHYGPTETVVGCAMYDVTANLASLGNVLPIGHAMHNTRLYVLDAAGRPCPVGVAGELYIGGAGVARGYVNRPELTAERFVADPFVPGARMYRTGDLVRRLSGGALEFIGRLDEQVKLRGYRIELGEIRAQLLRHPGVREALVLVQGEQGSQRLLAYLVPQQEGDAPGLVDSVRAQLQQALPDYMVPSGFAVLAALPLTANGKIDRKALPAIEQGGMLAEFAEPVTPAEQVLCKIWQQLLRVERVGIHDNFFALGGDSILSIQVVARAKQAGLGITTRQLFAHQTVAELAAQAGAVANLAPQHAVEGELAMLPIQRQFVAQSVTGLEHFNQSVLLLPPAGLDEPMLRKMVEAVYRRHDALRLQWQQAEDGSWSAQHMPLDAMRLKAAVCQEALPADPAAHSAFVAERCGFWQRASDPCQGPLLRAVLFAGSAPRLFLVAHHLVVDGVSWRILLADLEQAYRQLAARKPIQLAPKSASLQQWGAAVEQYAQSPRLAAELPFWLAQLEQPVAVLPQHAVEIPPAQSTTRTAGLALNAQETDALLRHCSQRYRTHINELLLAGVYLGMQRWSGADGVRLLLEGHGRAELDEQIDTSQTVGWFTSTYPLALRCGSSDVGEVIMQVKEQYRAVPQQGFGYSVLRHVAGDARLAQAEAAHPAQLVFNYLGQFDQSVGEDSLFRAAQDGSGAAIDPARARHCLLGLNGKVAGGVLGFTLDYSSEQFDAGAMADLARQIEAGLRDVVQHCAHAPAGQFTPGDFPLAKVSRAELDGWQREYAIAKLYPATSMQQGMLFHSLLDSSAYVTLTYPVLEGLQDRAAFRAAWQAVSAHYDIFRTAFVGQGDRLHQLVQPSAELPWVEEDWRHLDEAAQRDRFAQVIAADRAQGYDTARAPLQRVGLYRLGEERYQLLWSHHHMLLDGWCTPLVYRDVMDAYRAIAAGHTPVLRSAAPYEDYIAWLGRQDRGQALQYWTDYLDGLQGPSQLPAGLRGAEAAAGQRSRHLQLDEAQTAALQRFARQQHTTINTVMQLAWAYLLHRYTGDSDVVFGTTVSGRPAEVPGIEEMIGLFINTVPVRVQFAPGQESREQLSALQSAFQSSTAYSYLSLSEIQQCSALQGSLFDSLLVFENYPLDAALEADGYAGLRLESLGSWIANGYKLTLNIGGGNSMQLNCSYDAASIGDAAAEALLGHLRTILLALGAGCKLDEVDLLGAAERASLLQAWQGQTVERDAACVHELFSAQAVRTPHAIAVRHAGVALDYATLERRANRLAHFLAEQGVEPGQRVGIYVERSAQLLVAMLGILKAGAAYVPFEPKNTRERIGHIIADAGIEWVLVQPGMMDRVPVAGIDVLALDDSDGWLAEYPSDAPAALAGPGDIAYVIYTSGSTGTPKGVEIFHSGLADYLAFAGDAYYAPALQGSLVVTSHGFDITVPALWLPLLRGDCVNLLEAGEELPDLAARLAAPDAAGQLLRMTPMHVRGLLDLLPQQPLAGRYTFVVGGEAFTVALARELQQRFPHSQLFNHYGPTETVVGCAMYDVTANLASLGNVLPIGHAMHNTRLYVLDAAGRPCPVGVAGELYIGGAGVAKGYVNRPELTAERFVADPFVPGARMYRTGDLVRRLSGGALEFIGRLDEQVKLRGYRIELGEIRAQLLRHPGVREALVLVQGEQGSQRLLAYLVPQQEGDAPGLVDSVRAQLQQALPDYMVPSGFAVLAALPLTANGKIDRKALPMPDAPEASHVEPQGDVEQRVARLFGQLLSLERVSAASGFFELGGHSLSAMRLINAVQAEFGIALSLKALMASQTVQAMAREIAAALARAGNAAGALNAENSFEMEW